MESAVTIQPRKKLLALIQACEVSQAGLARALGISRKLVSLWYTDRQAMSPKHYIPLLHLASATTREYLQTRFPATAPLTREDVDAENAHAQTCRRVYEAIHEAVDEYEEVYTQVLTTITNAEDTIAHLKQTPIRDRSTVTHDQILEAATYLLTYSKVKEELEYPEWNLWKNECHVVLELLAQWEEERDAQANL